MSTKPGIKLIPLDTDSGTVLSLGWKPRDARMSADRKRHRKGDLRWLRVHGDIRCERGNWTFMDECLTEPEGATLIQWLGQRPWPDGADLDDFIEPCLAFGARGVRDGRMILQVKFAAEASPPWLRDEPNDVWWRGWTLEMAVQEHQLQGFAAGLHRLLHGTAT